MKSKILLDGNKDISLAKTHKQHIKLPEKFLYQLSQWLNNFARGIEAFLIQQSLHAAGLRRLDEIPTYTSKRELRTLYKLAAGCPHGARALEIGAHLGASSCYLAAGLLQIGGALLCVDTWQNDAMPGARQDTFSTFQENIYPLRHIITPLRKNSRDLTSADVQKQFDLIFIDGDHSYEAVGREFVLVQSWLTTGGTIAFHDFSHKNHEGVTRVVGESLAGGDWVLAGLVDSLAWIKRAQWQQSFSSLETKDGIP